MVASVVSRGVWVLFHPDYNIVACRGTSTPTQRPLFPILAKKLTVNPEQDDLGPS